MTISDLTAHPTRVAVVGAAGRMGSLACRAVDDHSGLELVARVGRGDSLDACAQADVVVEFAGEEGSRSTLRWALDHGTDVIIGSSGLGIDEIKSLVASKGGLGDTAVLVIPNFSISALLVRRFAAKAAPHFDSVAIVEYAGSHKKDAPSGTSVEAAREIGAALTPSRRLDPTTDDARQGAFVDGVPIASVRLAGMLSHQEVILSSEGDSVRLRFDTFDRSAYRAGVVAAIESARSATGLLIGLESVVRL